MTAAAATSDPRATDAAAAVLRAGGNAVDAAVTAAFVLYVVEPQSCGIGGDGFMFVHRDRGAPDALGGSGSVPHGLTSSALAADGLDNVPARGAKTVTPPGAVRLLEDALERYGTIPLATAIAPAHDLARQGFAVRGTLAVAARSAQTNSPDVTNDPVLGPLYWPGGDAVVDGDIVVNHALADALELLAEHGSEAMRTGSLADAIATTVAEHGGYLTREDLAEHETEIITPASIDFAGHTVWQMPAPTQGPAVLAALRDVDASDTIEWAEVVRVMRAAMVEAGFDPAAVTVGTPSPAKGDTTFLAVMDHDGTGVSLITSVFGDFGSHLGIGALGGPIHNRATTFRLAARPLGPGKPPHTTIPGLVTGPSGELRALVGVAGGVMQPQTQVQLIMRMLLEGRDPQDAIDQPRFKICFGGGLSLEAGHPLAPRFPEALEKNPGPEGFGAAQVVAWHDGALAAGADRRRGGTAIVLTGRQTGGG